MKILILCLFLLILSIIGANYPYFKGLYNSFMEWGSRIENRAEASALVVTGFVLVLYLVLVIAAY